MKPGRHTELVSAAMKDAFGDLGMFVDCSAGSPSRLIAAQGVVPCVCRSHPVYSVELGRYLGPQDFLNAQGLWSSAFTDSVYASILADKNMAQSFAGNSFSTTVVQAVFLTSLTMFESSWQTLCQRGASSCNQLAVPPPARLARIGKKRKAPEYDHLIPVPKKSVKPSQRLRQHKRKVPGQDLRKCSTGKKPVASLWEKENLSCPQLVPIALRMPLHTDFILMSCLSIYLSLSLYIYIYL